MLAADTLPDLLEALTDITGKPVMLPAFGYGLTIVNNEQELSYSIVYRSYKKADNVGFLL